MDNIINSLLDTDLYKMTMQQAVLELFPNTNVSYRFKNRGKQRFTQEFITELKQQIDKMSELKLTTEEYYWLKENIPFFKPAYLEYLKNYRFNPKEVNCKLNQNNDLEIEISGKWKDTILWEVPLMALISELYFKIIDTNWDIDAEIEGVNRIDLNAYVKIYKLYENNCQYAEFGTRRRKSFEVQDKAINFFSNFNDDRKKKTFVGTSNIYFAMKYGIKVVGTMAHEWIMGMSVLEGLRNANYYALTNWKRVYTGDLGIALTDTYGTDAFLKNFTKELAKLYDGVRHDSGCPYNFTDKIITHYKKLNINLLSKVIVFSDGLNVDKAIEIKKYCEGKINCSFGIGTFITNDFENSPALNMVIKLYSCEGVPVVKLSDAYGKVMGDTDAVRIARWTFDNEPLDD